MARTGPASELAVKKERWNRWRVLLRRPDFQKDCRAVRQYCLEHHGASDKKGMGFLHKWDLQWFPFERFSPWRNPETPPLSPETVKLYETFFQDEPICDAVTAYDSYDGPHDEWIPQPGIRRGQFLTIEADLSYPLTDLLNRIEGELKKAIGKRSKSESKGYLPPDRTRRRHDSLTDQLDVFDLYMSGAPTWQIARTLKKPLGTVKSALSTAMELMQIERPGRGGSWKRRHLAHCARCGRNTINWDCPTAADYYRSKARTAESALKKYERSKSQASRLSGTPSDSADFQSWLESERNPSETD